MKKNTIMLFTVIFILVFLGVAIPKTLIFKKNGLKIEAFKIAKGVSYETIVKVKVTNISGGVRKYAQVTCVLYNGKEKVDADNDYLQWHYTGVPMPNGASYHHTYNFSIKLNAFDSIGFDVTENE